MKTGVAVRFAKFGDPRKVLRLEEEAVADPGPGEVVLRVLASPINPSDLGTIAGSYGQLPALPATPGREGVAEVEAVGAGAGELTPGQRVLLPEGRGCWRSHLLADAADLVAVPEGAPVEQAAMASINPPTAQLLLDEFVRLEHGDWVIQNAASSAVGHYVIQLCRARGVRTINVVRRPEWVDRLKAIGADAVLVAGEADLPREVRDVTGGALPRLGLNSVGGPLAIALTRCLAEGGVLVTFGGMTGEPVRFPTRQMIFHDIRLVGFWLARWKKRAAPGAWRRLLKESLEKIAAGEMYAPVEATFRLEEMQEAIARASAPKRDGKVLFRMG